MRARCWMSRTMATTSLYELPLHTVSLCSYDKQCTFAKKKAVFFNKTIFFLTTTTEKIIHLHWFWTSKAILWVFGETQFLISTFRNKEWIKWTNKNLENNSEFFSLFFCLHSLETYPCLPLYKSSITSTFFQPPTPADSWIGSTQSALWCCFFLWNFFLKKLHWKKNQFYNVLSSRIFNSTVWLKSKIEMKLNSKQKTHWKWI